MPPIGDSLAAQFARCWEMLRDVVRKTPEERWRADANPQFTPARWALHAVQAVDAYQCTSLAEVDWTPRFCHGLDGPVEQLPTRDQLLTYLDEVAASLETRLCGMTDEEMLSPPPFHWTGATYLEHWLYGLRHTHSHLGELNMLLRIAGDETGIWR
ncbi:MAG: DinB family protein [Armatimonadetes bacterium]|nr:DinB family protein [Armatimonadota bacterium]